MLLLNHQKGVSADDDEVNFAFSALFNIRDTNRFKHVPSVLFPSRSADFCKALFRQFPCAVNVVGRMVPPPFSPPTPPL